jgi:hypothetical protein
VAMQGDKPAKRKERGVILLLGSLSMPVLISMMGLAIDASVLSAVKTKLQLATDGASVAAARALSLGTTTAAQATSAQNNAISWFNKNYPANTLASTSITVDTPSVFDDPVQPLIRHVQVTSHANAPSFFMRFWGREYTPITAFSEATRRDSVIMMVLDRSGSMNSGGACAAMKSAAKQFTSLFAVGRDRIGLITFNMASNIAASPTTNFQNVIGSTTSTSALLDNLSCNGGTGTPQATILGYNELYKVALPGALNVLLVFTDGEPNVVTLDFRGGNSSQMGIMEDTTNCQDSRGYSLNSGASPRGHINTYPPSWTSGWSFGTGSFLSAVPSGPIASIYADATNSWAAFRYRSTSVNSTSDDSAVTASGCSFGTGSTGTYFNNVEWLPDTDVYGIPLELSGFYSLTRATIDGTSRIIANNYNAHYAAYNAAANAANVARTTRNLPSGTSFPGVYVYCIGLGNVNHQLLQRMANDPNGDTSGNNYYSAFTGYNPNQPVGTYVYAEDSSRLSQAFGQIASFILRISQ